MRYITYILLALVLSACGTTSTVKLAIQAPEKTSFTFHDERQPEQKLSRIDKTVSGATIIYGDDNLSPTAIEILCATLQERMSAQLEGMAVSLSKFDVRVFEPTASVDFNSLRSASASVPGGYAAEPLAALLIMGIENIKSEKVVSVDIEGTLNTTKFATSVSDRYRGRVTEKNLQTSLEQALDQLTTELQQIVNGKLEVGDKEMAASQINAK